MSEQTQDQSFWETSKYKNLIRPFAILIMGAAIGWLWTVRSKSVRTEQRVDHISQDLSDLEGKISDIRSKQRDLYGRIRSMNGKMTKLAENLPLQPHGETEVTSTSSSYETVDRMESDGPDHAPESSDLPTNEPASTDNPPVSLPGRVNLESAGHAVSERTIPEIGATNHESRDAGEPKDAGDTD